jgi:hypothetical protein
MHVQAKGQTTGRAALNVEVSPEMDADLRHPPLLNLVTGDVKPRYGLTQVIMPSVRRPQFGGKVPKLGTKWKWFRDSVSGLETSRG